MSRATTFAPWDYSDMNPTTEPTLRSWVFVPADSDFPIQNLPFGIFRPHKNSEPRVGVAIGEQVLDLSVLEAFGFFNTSVLRHHRVFGQGALNAFLALGKAAWSEARATVSRMLSAEEPALRDQPGLRSQALMPMREVEMLLPANIGDYTDFYSSREHATNVGTMLRGADKALMPNWLHLPVAYHGRASSIVVSGTDLHRPLGQMKPDSAEVPLFGPSRSVDFELEVGCMIGPGNNLGEPIPVERALDHVFGLVLLNDWSARDIQAWEYVPLGPFLAKNFGTSISPWVVSLEALEPFRTTGPTQDPLPFPYLRTTGPSTFDIHLEVILQSEKMDRPQRICASNFKHLYWSLAQQVAHHTINGCNLKPGDLLASGTISGAMPDSYGSMLELAWRGSKPLPLSNGEQRSFLQDGDRVTFRGWCQGDHRIGFGEVTGCILPARQM
jgi:fumarylacetoacetase